MGRPARITETDLLAAVSRVCARLGPARASVAAIAKEAGVPVGSVYHRLPSRGALLAETWLAAAARFQAQFLERLGAATDADAAIDAALATPRFARADFAAAVVLFAHGREAFLLPDAAAAQRARAAELAAALREGLAAAAARLLPGVARGRERLAVALIGIPHGAVRVFLPQAVPPKEIDDVIAAAVRGAMGSG